jgi:hypothetical protein
MAEDVSIMQEIDEALRADKLQQLWARHNEAILTFCVMAVLASAGSVLWKNHLHDLHERQTGWLAEAATLEQQGKYDAAAGVYQKVEDEGGALAGLAGIRHAAVLISLKQEDKALALYNSVAGGKEGDTPVFRDFAALEAAILAGNQSLNAGKPASAATAAAGGIFHQSATELGALNALGAGDRKTASFLLGSILSDEAAPYSQRARASELLDSIKEHKK